MILITAATGTVGSEVITALLPARNVGHDATDPITTLHRAGDITAVTGRPARSFTDRARAHRTGLLAPEAVQNAATTGESR